MTKILIVEDEADFAYGLRNNLEIEGYEVDHVGDGLDAFTSIVTSPPDLVILDLRIPGMTGLELLRRIRGKQIPVRVLVLSALKEEMDVVRGLRIGADDYMVKPFSLKELLARIAACLRRPVAAPAVLAAHAEAAAERYGTAVPDLASPVTISFGRCTLDLAARQVLRDGQAIELQPVELKLLLTFLRNPGRVMTRAELLADVWVL